MGLADELRFSLYHQSDRVLKVVASITLGFFLVAGLCVGGYALYLRTTEPPPKSANDARIPLTAFAPSMLQAYTCILDGPKKCDQHDRAKKYLTDTSPPGGIRYTPLSPRDPGTTTPDKGHRQVKLGKHTTPAQWKALATAITLNRQANPSTVNETTVEKQGENEVTYPIPARNGSPAAVGTMRFRIADGQVSMQSVTYAKAGAPDASGQPEKAPTR